jgi:hypothetical protein
LTGLLVLAVLGVAAVRVVHGADLDEAKPKPGKKASEVVGYVIDLQKPDWITLANEVGVGVTGKTLYAFQTEKGSMKAHKSDVRVGREVRITVGDGGVATHVLILRPR